MTDQQNEYEVSVIVPTYNRSKLLGYTLQSLALQNINKSRFEVIVTDDGSADDSRGVAEWYGNKMNVRYKYQPDEGYRPATARNNGIKTANGTICVFIDAGIIAAKDCLEQHIHFYAGQSQAVAAIGYIYGLSGDQEAEARLLELFDPCDPAAVLRTISSQEIYLDVREPHFRLHNDRIHDLPAPWFFFWSGHISVLRDHLLQVGLFDEAYNGNWGIEDNDLGFRLWAADIQLHLLRSAHCMHYPHSTHYPGKLIQGKKNCAYFNSKYQTFATGLFLEHFGANEFVDINLLIRDHSGIKAVRPS